MKKIYIQYDFIYMTYPEQANLQKQKGNYQLTQARNGNAGGGAG